MLLKLTNIYLSIYCMLAITLLGVISGELCWLTMCAWILTATTAEDMPGITDLKPILRVSVIILKWFTCMAQPGFKPRLFTTNAAASPGKTKKKLLTFIFPYFNSGLSWNSENCFDKLSWLRTSPTSLNGAGLTYAGSQNFPVNWGEGNCLQFKMMEDVIVQGKGLWSDAFC